MESRGAGSGALGEISKAPPSLLSQGSNLQPDGSVGHVIDIITNDNNCRRLCPLPGLGGGAGVVARLSGTGDDDLLSLESVEKIEIISPKQFLERYASPAGSE